jgi:UDP-N-acetylglucosamine--N-acetylmuramyl-(pentapeptide) pyrophosphoryl-undecaprenol N-acetylglucosamine transferase
MTTHPDGPIVLAAGGTGGHMFPAAALAAMLLARGHRVALVTDTRGAASQAFGDRVAMHVIRAGRMSGGIAGRLRGLVDLGRGIMQARRLLRALAPRAVVGFGGYASAPPMLAAIRAGVPTLLHEQNAVLGRANRMLAARVRAIALSLPRTAGLKVEDSDKAHLTGNPVRAEIAALGQHHYPTPQPGGPFRIMVLGGSLGARVFSTIVPAAVALLDDAERARLQIVQQCRAEDLDAATAAYAATSVRTLLLPFINDVPARLADAHLLVCRAGASTVAELTAAGRPALLVPYPSAADDHQTANAQRLDDAGAAWLMPEHHLTPEMLAARLSDLMASPETLERAAACARAAGHPDADRRLADLVEALIHGRGRSVPAGAQRMALWEAAE